MGAYHLLANKVLTGFKISLVSVIVAFTSNVYAEYYVVYAAPTGCCYTCATPCYKKRKITHRRVYKTYHVSTCVRRSYTPLVSTEYHMPEYEWVGDP